MRSRCSYGPMASLSWEFSWLSIAQSPRLYVKWAQLWSAWFGRDVMLLNARPLKSMSWLKSLAKMILCLERWLTSIWI